MWKEVEKLPCLLDIINGKINLDFDEVVVVGFMDNGFVEPLNNTEIGTMKFLIECDEIKFFQKVVDKSNTM